MNLIIFPESANLKNGYGIAVDYAYNKLKPSDNDLIIWYTNEKDLPKFQKNNVVIPRPKIFSFKRFKNMLSNKLGAELIFSDLNFLIGKEFENIYCDDVIFYRAVRKLFPKNNITVRFHNCFTRIQDRKNILGIRDNLFFEIKLLEYQKLEREIFRDNNIYKIFISKEDDTYYRLMTGRSDSIVWPFEVDKKKALINRTNFIFENKLVWFGGLQDHKLGSMIYFIKYVLPKIKINKPSIELHLWGSNTKRFHNPENNIFGHGYYTGIGFPFKSSALYINPDIIGGGIKLKVKSYYEEGLVFVTTPFGFEGYSSILVDNKFCIVAELNQWSQIINSILNK